MILLVASLAALTPVTASAPPIGAAQPSVAAGPVCQMVRLQSVISLTPPVPHVLTAEPPAKAFSAVVYSEAGCMKPVIVREQIGAQPTP